MMNLRLWRGASLALSSGKLLVGGLVVAFIVLFTVVMLITAPLRARKQKENTVRQAESAPEVKPEPTPDVAVEAVSECGTRSPEGEGRPE